MTADVPGQSTAPASEADQYGDVVRSDVPLGVPERASGIELPGVIPLIAPARRVLAVLAALDGAADAPAAVIAAHADLTTPQTLRHLRHLVRNGLAQPGKADTASFRAAPGPFPLRPAVLTFACYARATAWHLGCAFEAARELGVAVLPGGEQIAPDAQRPPHRFADRTDALGWFVDERDRLLEEVGLARELGNAAHAWRLALLVLNISTLVGRWDGWQRVYEHGLAAAFRDSHRAARAMLEERGGILELAGGDAAAARRCHQRALEVRSADGDSAGVVRSIYSLGLTWLREDSLPEAEILLEEALALAIELGDEEYVGLAWMSLGTVHARTGRTDTAIDLLHAAIPPLRSSGRDAERSAALTTIAFSHRLAGDLLRAEQAALEAETLAVESGISLLSPGPLVEHAHVQAALGHLRVARALLHEAEGICHELGDESRALHIRLEICRIGRCVSTGPTDDAAGPTSVSRPVVVE